MSYTVNISLFSIGLFAAMLLLLEVGRRMGIRRQAEDPDGARTGAGAVEGAVFALLGLLIAFTFSGAATRLDSRRQLIVDDANAIGTAYLRLDLLQGPARDQLRQDFRRYAEARLAVYKKLPDIPAAKLELAKAMGIQGEIWKSAVTACRDQGSQAATMLLLPALNQMIDISTTRVMATKIHPPTIIYAMLTILALIGAIVAGYAMTGKKRSWIHIIGFALITAATVYVILDIEYPRLGMIRADETDAVMSELLESMK